MKKFIKVIVGAIFLFSTFNILFAQTSGSVSENIIWQFTASGAINSSPILHNGIIYIGSNGKNLYALNSQTGAEIWKFSTPKMIRSTPAIANDKIYIESGNVLYALNLDAQQQWQFDLYSTNLHEYIDNWDYFHSSPNIVNGIVFIGTEHGLVYGIDAESGQEQFKIELANHNMIRTNVLFENGKVYFGDWGGYFYCYDYSSKQPIWTFDAYSIRAWNGGAQISTSPVLANGKIYFAGRGSVLYCLNAETGDMIWNFRSPTNQWLVGGPMYNDGKIFLGSSDQKWFRAFDAENGTIIWEKKVKNNIFSTACLCGDIVYFGTGSAYDNNQGEVVAMNKNTGELVNEYIMGTNVHSSPHVDNGIVYFGTARGVVYALNAIPTTNIENKTGIIDSFELYQNYPNPFNPQTKITYLLAESGNVSLIVYDTVGNEVKTLVDKYQNPGKYEMNFSAKDLASGIYYCTLKHRFLSQTRKMLVLK